MACACKPTGKLSIAWILAPRAESRSQLVIIAKSQNRLRQARRIAGFYHKTGYLVAHEFMTSAIIGHNDGKNGATAGVVQYRNNSLPVNDLPVSTCGYFASVAHLRGGVFPPKPTRSRSPKLGQWATPGPGQVQEGV